MNTNYGLIEIENTSGKNPDEGYSFKDAAEKRYNQIWDYALSRFDDAAKERTALRFGDVPNPEDPETGERTAGYALAELYGISDNPELWWTSRGNEIPAGMGDKYDLYREIGREFMAKNEEAYDKAIAEHDKKQQALSAGFDRYLAGDPVGVSVQSLDGKPAENGELTEQLTAELLQTVGEDRAQKMQDVRGFMAQYVKPLGDRMLAGEISYQEMLHQLDGLEAELMDATGDDQESIELAVYALMNWAKRMSDTNAMDAGDELMVAVGRQLSNWANIYKDDWEEKSWEDEISWALGGRARTLRARGMLRNAIDESIKISDTEAWYNKLTRVPAQMLGSSALYINPVSWQFGLALGATNTLIGGQYETTTQLMGNGMSYEEASTKAWQQAGINAAVEAMPFGLLGGPGANKMIAWATRGGVKPGSIAARLHGYSTRSIWHALGVETGAGIVEEGLLEPVASGLMEYGSDYALDLAGMPHGGTESFRACFRELKETWNDPYQIAGLAIFSAGLAGSSLPRVKSAMRELAKNRNTWKAMGLSNAQVDVVMGSESPTEKGREMLAASWAEDPAGMTARVQAANKKLAASGSVLFLTGQQAQDAEVDDAAAAVWQDAEKRGWVPHIERQGENYLITKPGQDGKPAVQLTLTPEQADVYLKQELQRASERLTRELSALTGRVKSVNIRESLANALARIGGNAAIRELQEKGEAQGILYEDVLGYLPGDIAEPIRMKGYIGYTDAQKISEYAAGQIEVLVNGGMNETEARSKTGLMGGLRSLGSWANFARDFAARAKSAGIAKEDAATNINRSAAGYRTIDGKTVMTQAILGVGGGNITTYGALEDITEAFADRMLDERARELEKSDGVSYEQGRAQALRELHNVVKRAREAILKADPHAQIEQVGETPDYMQVVEALSTMAVSQFATSNYVPKWMRSLSVALRGNLQAAGSIEAVRAAYANVLRDNPDAIKQLDELLGKLGVQVGGLLREARMTAADVNTWRKSAGAEEMRAEMVGNEAMPVSSAVREAEETERQIIEEDAAPVAKEENPKTASTLAEEFTETLNREEPSPTPENMLGVFEGGCVYNAAGDYYCGLIDKTKLQDGTEQVKVGARGKHGVIAGRELTGNFQASAAPLIVWKRKDGSLRVISGRHRYELMLRDESCKSPLCYVYEENEQHNEQWARLTDYENNMRDDQADELTAATYVRETGYSDDVLRQKGLMRNESRSKRGALIGRVAREELWVRFKNGSINAKDAEIVCKLTRNISDEARVEAIQRQCCQLLEKGKSWDYIGAMCQLMANKDRFNLKRNLPRAARYVEKNLLQLNAAIRTLKQGAKLGEKERAQATRLGIDVSISEGSEQLLQLLNDLKAKFENIGTYPDLVADASLWDGKTAPDPVGQMLERAKRDRDEADAENALTDEEWLEKKEREQAAAATQTLFAMTSEQTEIMQRAQSSGTWLKAPNGEPTRLTERQWLQVRTEAFKRWFGDWEKVARFKSAVQQLLSMSEVASITGTEFAPDGRKLTDKVTEFWNKEYGGVAKNPALGDVALDARSVKASIAHGIGRLKSAAFAVVHDVIERGVLVEIAPNWKGRGEDSYVIAAPVQIGNTAYVCEVVVMKGETRTGFYLHEVQIKEKLLDVFKTGVITGTSGAPKSILLDVWNRVKQIEENCSKVVDENGEPKVVTHATNSEPFTEFRRGVRPGLSGKGIYFSPDGVGIWGRNIMRVFLNVRNPLTKNNAPFAVNNGGMSKVIPDVFDKYPEYDGVMLRRDEITVRDPTQIKSATDNRGTFDLSNADITLAMTRGAADALTILRKRETEREGERLIRDWQAQCELWAKLGGTDDAKIGRGSRIFGELLALVSATRGVLPPKYTRLRGLAMSLQWAEIYADMVNSGEVPMRGVMQGRIYEKFVSAIEKSSEKYRDYGLSHEEVAENLKELAGRKLEHVMQTVAVSCRRNLERYLKDRERERLEKIAKAAMPKEEPGKKTPRGKVSEKVARQVKTALELMDKERNDIADLIDNARDGLDRLDPDDPEYSAKEEQLQEQAYMANTFGDWSGMTLEEARAAADTMAQIVSQGRAAWKDKLDRERRHIKYIIGRVSRNFRVPLEEYQGAGAKRDIAEKSRGGRMLSRLPLHLMNFADLMLVLRPVLGKEFCDGQRAKLAEYHIRMQRFGNDLRRRMLDTAAKITGLKSERDLAGWINDLNQEEHTGIHRREKVEHSVVLTIEDAQRWLAMSESERQAERERLIREAEEAELAPPADMPTEEHISKLQDALTAWQDKDEAARARQKYLKATVTSYRDMGEIVATKEGILYNLLLLEQDDYEHLSEFNGLDAASLDALKDYIGPQVMSWGYAMRQMLQEQGKELAKYYEAWTGVPFPSNPLYFPGAFDMSGRRNADEKPDQQEGISSGITGGKLGFLIKRRHHNSKLDWLISATQIFRGAMHEQYNYICVSDLTREWRSMLADREFARRLKAEVGADVLTKLNAWVDMLDGALLTDGRWNRVIARILRPILSCYALSRLAGNVYTWIKQASGIVHGFIGGYVPDKTIENGQLVRNLTTRHIGFCEYWGAFAKCLVGQNTITLADVRNSKWIKERDERYGRTFERATMLTPGKKIAGKVGRVGEAFTDATMDTMETVDINSNAVSMLALVNAVYDRAMAENKDGLVPEAQIREVAMKMGGMMIDLAAQPKLRTQKSFWGASNTLGGVISNFLMLFKTESLNKAGLIMAQLLSGEKRYAIGSMLTFGLANTLILYAINWVRGYGFMPGDDDDEWWETAAQVGYNVTLADLTAVPIIGEGIDIAKSQLLGGKHYTNSFADMVLPINEFYNAGKRESRNIRKRASWDKHVQAITGLTRAAGASGGVLDLAGCSTLSALVVAAATAGNLARVGKDVYKRAEELLKGNRPKRTRL